MQTDGRHDWYVHISLIRCAIDNQQSIFNHINELMNSNRLGVQLENELIEAVRHEDTINDICKYPKY